MYKYSIINPLLPRPAKTGHFVILLCLMLDDFTRQGRAFGCMEKGVYIYTQLPI